MLNVSATQEQQRRIEALEQENAVLKAKNASFEARLQALETKPLSLTTQTDSPH